jgi:hypothetical protein
MASAVERRPHRRFVLSRSRVKEGSPRLVIRNVETRLPLLNLAPLCSL